MPLPINIHDLLNCQSIESERLEFKSDWNPESILHTICAFANDLNNWGGGYIIVGVSENNGKPILPPLGINHEKIDAIQRKLLELCHLITPNYYPVAVPVVYENRHIFIIWCPGGDVRPYKTVQSLALKSSRYYYIRRFSSTVKASLEEEQLLMQLTSKTPFDDRINHLAQIEDLNITIINEYLKKVGSDLYGLTENIPFPDLCRQMQIARGSSEFFKPLNIALLMFNTNPSKFFKGARIEIVEYFDDIGDVFTEKIFDGPIHYQLKAALQYIQNTIIKEKIRKVDGQAEAQRFFNYPFSAIEEALANAVYHRSYENLNPIEVSIYKDHIDILSFPGPLPPVNENELKKDKLIVRDYRNRRIGDFLKELGLTEGRSTGIPKIRRALKLNASPEPEFHTDDDRTYFLSVLYANNHFIIDAPVNAPVNAPVKLSLIQEEILEIIKNNPKITYDEIVKITLKNRTTIMRNISELKKRWIKRVGSNKSGYWEIVRE